MEKLANSNIYSYIGINRTRAASRQICVAGKSICRKNGKFKYTINGNNGTEH